MARMETTTNATIDLMASGRNTREGYEIVSDPVVQARIDATNASLDKHRLEMEKKFPLPSALRKQKEEEERRALEESVKESVANVASVRNVLSSLKASKSFAFASGSSKRQGGSNDGSSRIAPQASAPDLLFVKDLSSDAAAESTAEAAAGAAAAAAPEEESAPEAGSPPVELAPPPVAAVESVPGAFGITEFGVLEEESQAAAAAAAAGGRESTAPEPEPEPPAPNTGVTLRSLPGRKVSPRVEAVGSLCSRVVAICARTGLIWEARGRSCATAVHAAWGVPLLAPLADRR